MAGLLYLNIGKNKIGDEGAKALAQSPHLSNLVALQLWGNRIGPAGIQALTSSPYLPRGSVLGLGDQDRA
jgi:hypothetical protein